jgi:hypothetical protein
MYASFGAPFNGTTSAIVKLINSFQEIIVTPPGSKSVICHLSDSRSPIRICCGPSLRCASILVLNGCNGFLHGCRQGCYCWSARINGSCRGDRNQTITWLQNQRCGSGNKPQYRGYNAKTTSKCQLALSSVLADVGRHGNLWTQ